VRIVEFTSIIRHNPPARHQRAIRRLENDDGQLRYGVGVSYSLMYMVDKRQSNGITLKINAKIVSYLTIQK
jgi:hypothetical protein